MSNLRRPVENPVAVRGAKEPRSVVPGPAAQNALAALSARRPCAPVRRSPQIAVVPAVLNPLPDIPVHVVQTKPVRRKRAHRNCLVPIDPLAARAIGAVPVIVRLIRRDRRAEVKRARRPRACRIFPFRLRSTSRYCFPRLSRQPPDIGSRVLPAHIESRGAGLGPNANHQAGRPSHPPPATQASHSENVTSYFPTANAAGIVTR